MYRHYTAPARRIHWRYITGEAALIIAACFAYFLVRGATVRSPSLAFDNADRVIRFQERLGLGWEVTMQEWIIESHALVTLANWVYMWGHWPVIGLVALWLVIVYPSEYRLVRNAFLISGGIGLIIFATFPVAPPRFVDPDIIDTVTEHSNSYRVLQPPTLVNQYAAVPSLHFGWNLLIGIFVFRNGRHLAVRAFGVVMPPIMFLAIVMTGNHYIVDGVAGAAVALTGLAIALWLRRRTASRANGGHATPKTATAT